ncbi:MAG: hypothetical protein ACE37D_21815 [Pseudomonadales bacterium]
MHRLILIVFLILAQGALAETCELDVSGSIHVNPLQEQDYLGWEDYFSAKEPLANVKIRLLGARKNRPFAQWEEATTDARGKFRFKVEKAGRGCRRDYKLRVQIKYASSTLNIKKPRNRTPDWFTIFQSKSAQTNFGDRVKLNNLVIARNNKWDRGSEIARQHGMIWITYQKLNDYLASLSPNRSSVHFAFKEKFDLRYPHNLKVVRDTKKGKTHEVSFANPITNTVAIVKNDRVNDLNVPILIHEMMHIWQYERMESIHYPTTSDTHDWALKKTRGQSGMVRYLIRHGTTHDEVTKEYVAFQEGFSWWFEELALERIFDVRPPKVLTRGHIYRHVAKSLDALDNHDVGWRQALTVMTLKEPLAYTYGDQDTEAVFSEFDQKRLNARKRLCKREVDSISVAFFLNHYSNHLTALNDPEDRAKRKELGPLYKGQMTLDYFLESVTHGDQYRRLLDPTNDEEYLQIFCDR